MAADSEYYRHPAVSEFIGDFFYPVQKKCFKTDQMALSSEATRSEQEKFLSRKRYAIFAYVPTKYAIKNCFEYHFN